MSEIDGRTGLEALDWDECLALLSQCSLGRLAVVIDDQPLIFPVNFALDESAIVFRNDLGTKVEGARNRRVAFECDGTDTLYHTGWSVLATGEAVQVRDPAERDRLGRLPLSTRSPGPKAIWLRIQPNTLTGRRIPPPHGQQPQQPTSHT
jgi:nitroimidazol reductase NimA-like FMN-containing flavoprotein (pyridoxamine 5'-phosphate oxidase superfamily)